MATERYFKNKKCRYYIDGGVWISSDGEVITYVKQDPRNTFASQWPDQIRTPRKVKRADGVLITNNRFDEKFRIDVAVATCWCPPRPNGYVISHKDGNLLNNDYRNLEWVEYHYQHSTANKTKIDVKGETIVVHKDGTIEQNKEKLIPYDYRYDPDTDQHFYREAKVSISGIQGSGVRGYEVDPELLIKKAGYIQGDDALFINPVILHRDYNPENLASDNLEWTENTDPRYLEYLKKKDEYRERRRKEIDEEFNRH